MNESDNQDKYSSNLFDPSKFDDGQPTPASLGLPWSGWRDAQWQAITSALFSDKRFIVIEAPTGIGKSGIAVALSRLSGRQGVILTSTKQLQEQYQSLGAKIVKGRNNFGCNLSSDSRFNLLRIKSAEDGPCTSGYDCQFKGGGCGYYDQKYIARDADVSVHSYSYFLNEANYAGEFSRDNQLIFCDEAHVVENEMRSFVEVSVPHGGMGLSKHPPHSLSDWKGWIRYANSMFDESYDRLTKDRHDLKLYPNDPDVIKRFKYSQKTHRTLRQMALMNGSWVIQDNPKYRSTILRPSWVHEQMNQNLLRHGHKIVFMSATILDFEMFCSFVGINSDDADFIQLDSPFNPSLRPLVIKSVMKVSRKANLKPLIDEIDSIIEAHEGEKGIVHTTSYWLAEEIISQSRHRDRLITHGSQDRLSSLERFKLEMEGTVLVSPSMGTGVDLPGEALRFQIIAKLPFPDLSDEQVKRRLNYGPDGSEDSNPGNRWYAWTTACSLIQTYGRAMRSEDDFGVTYLLDSNWQWWYKQWRQLIPPWVRSAIVS